MEKKIIPFSAQFDTFRLFVFEFFFKTLYFLVNIFTPIDRYCNSLNIDMLLPSIRRKANVIW